MRAWGVLIVLALAVAGVGCRGGGTVTMPSNNGEVNLRLSLVREVEGRWKGARVAADTARCGTGAASPAVVTGDVNGDGSADLVIRVEQEGKARLFAALAHASGAYDVRDVSGDQDVPPGPAVIERRGTLYRRMGLVVDEYLAAETLIINGCDGRRTAFIWTGSVFAPEALASGTTATK